jgi:hypothetical protein
MIDPKDFLSSNNMREDDDLIDLEGSFSCPEQGCYELTTLGKFNERERIITWTCINGHAGRAGL